VDERLRRAGRGAATADVVVTVDAIDPDDYDRAVKLLVDEDPSLTWEAAAALLATYRLQVFAGARACENPAWQAALLTVVNAGGRAVHGGVRVLLGADPVCVLPWARGRRLSEAVAALGGETSDGTLEDGVPAIVLGPRGEGLSARGAPVVRAVAGTWVALVGPEVEPDGQASVLAAVLAGAIAVSECFQWLRGHTAAGDRVVRVSLWDPEGGSDGPSLVSLPAGLWLLGLGHLGQAYAWLLGLLPYPVEGARPLVLQDDDRLSRANRATSMLHRGELVRVRKTRLVAGAMDELGWDTALVERRYLGGPLRVGDEPQVLLGGLDNVQARRVLDDAGFAVVYDAGLGAGPDSYLAMTIRRLPASRSSREIWPAGVAAPVAVPRGAAYAALEASTSDRCGVEQLAGRSVATAFVGCVAACFVVGGLLRELHGGPAFELVDLTLRDPSRVVAVNVQAARAPRVATVPWAG
jgi:hypothetical protein